MSSFKMCYFQMNFGANFLHNFFLKKCSLFNTLYMNKVSFSYLFPFSRYQIKNVFLGSYLDNWWHHELYLQSSSNAMIDREKRRGEHTYQNLNISLVNEWRAIALVLAHTCQYLFRCAINAHAKLNMTS